MSEVNSTHEPSLWWHPCIPTTLPMHQVLFHKLLLSFYIWIFSNTVDIYSHWWIAYNFNPLSFLLFIQFFHLRHELDNIATIWWVT